MTYSTLLEHNTTTLVLDTSVLLNLFSCNYGLRICKCLPNKILLSNIVLDEFWSRYEINEKKRFIEYLDNENLIDCYTIDDLYLIWNFYELRNSGLGLGEIATIDIASKHKLIPVIDEKKATKVAKNQYGLSKVARSTDIIMHRSVYNNFTYVEYVDSIFYALYNSRMHIEYELREKIVDLIGIERANLCPSIPKIRSKK